MKFLCPEVPSLTLFRARDKLLLEVKIQPIETARIASQSETLSWNAGFEVGIVRGRCLLISSSPSPTASPALFVRSRTTMPERSRSCWIKL